MVPASYRECFGCGDDNAAGINLVDIRRDDDVVRATFRPKTTHQGFPDLLHGGVAAAALDEMMGYACILIGGKWAVTAKMELRFRRPVRVSDVLALESGLHESSARRFKAWSKIVDDLGNVRVEATGLFLPAPETIIEELLPA